MAPILGYWGVRGRGGVIRMLLHHAEVQFEDKHYVDFETWFKVDKPALAQNGMDFPNLPYLIDGDVKISESRVLIEYLGRKYDLDATTETERIRIGLAMEIMEGYKQGVTQIAYPPQCVSNRQEVHEKLYKEYEEQIPDKVVAVSKFLGNRNWMAGDRITYADFVVYDVLDWMGILFSPKYIEADGNLNAYMKRIEELPGVKKFMASSAYIRLPIFGPFAMLAHTADWKPV